MERSKESTLHDIIEDHDITENQNIIDDHDEIEEVLIKKFSSVGHEPNSVLVTDANSVKSTIKDSVSAKASTLQEKIKSSHSIPSGHSQLMSIKNLTSSNLMSHTVTTNISSKTNKDSVSNMLISKEISQISGVQKEITHDEIKKFSSNYISREQSIALHSLNEASIKSDKIQDLKLKCTHSLVQENNISPWEKASSKSSSKSQLSTKLDETGEEINLKCIPPWAKTIRKIYGMNSSDSREDMSQTNLQEKIKGLMDKHSRLMLVKRGESRKQLILNPNECGEMGAVKITSKNTKYYMTPLKANEDVLSVDNRASASSRNKTSEHQVQENDDMSVTMKTSRSQAKREVSQVLKSLYNTRGTQRDMEKDSRTLKQQHIKCPKITPSNVRAFVNAQTLDPDQRQLHEIIKIKKVPSLGTQDGRKASSKYIINVPKCTKGDGATVNKITVKEKRKLRINSVEDINENITEIVYNKSDCKEASGYIAKEHYVHDVVPYSKHSKSPTKSKVLEVTAESTPVISNLIKKEERDKDKILLIQYEKKSKPCEGKSDTDKPTMISTKLLGVKQTCSENLKEMYLYGTESNGKKTKENVTKVDDVSPTLREKVNMIFQELREMTFKPCTEPEALGGELQPSDSSKPLQYPPTFVETDAVSVQALPEVRSAEVQVNDSMLLSPSQLQLIETHSTPTSLDSEQHKQEIIDNLLDDITDIDQSQKTTETEPKTRSQVEKEKSPTVEENLEEVVETDDTMLSESDEGEVSRESKRSIEDISKEEQIQLLEETETESKDDISESEFKQTKYDNQEEIISKNDELTKKAQETLEGEQETLEGEQETLEGEQETLTDEDSLKTEEESKKEIKDDKLKKDKDLENILEEKNLWKEEDLEEGVTKKYGKGEGKEESEIIDGTKLPYNNLARFSEDIRSYDFDPSQISQLKIVSSAKFFHQRHSIRKMNWSDDVLYIERSICPKLVKALAEIALRQPADPISFLAHWIYKDYYNRESEEQKLIHKEHIELTKDMLSPRKDEKLVCKKFSVRRYPMKKYSSIVSTKSVSSHVTEETEIEDLKDED